MGQLIDFESAGVASLRRRVAAAEEANRDLVAFARGRSGTVAAVHVAALAAADAEGAEHLVHIVTQAWPDLLGVDAVAFAVVLGSQAWRGDASGLHAAVPPFPGEDEAVEGVLLRGVSRGHALFGPACDLIRTEALVRLDGPPPLSAGVLLLGQRRVAGVTALHGAEPLLFLGQLLSRMMVRWLPR